MWGGPHVCGQHPDSRGGAGLAPQCLLHGAQEASLDLPQLCARHLELAQALLHLEKNRPTSGQEPSWPSQASQLQPALPSSYLLSPAQTRVPPSASPGWPNLFLSPAGLSITQPHPHLFIHSGSLATSSGHPAPTPSEGSFLEGKPTHVLLLHSLMAPQLTTPPPLPTSLNLGFGKAFLLTHRN